MFTRAQIFGGLLVLGLGCCHSSAKKNKHEFDDDEVVTVWLNQVGPYNNPQETYEYIDLPFCRPAGFHTVKKREGLGEILEGNELVDSNLHLRFKSNVAEQEYCTLAVDKGVEAEFLDAVQNLYWYQLYIDDLPQWGMVGEWVQDPDTADKIEGLLYTHKNIAIGYTDNRIMEVNLTSEKPVLIERGTSLKFTYSVEWKPVTGIKWKDRFKRYLDNNFFEHQIHWFSIFNSFMMVIFLTGLVTLILMRTLRHDYAKYAAEDEGFEQQGADDSGWKQVHGDVFRTPAHLSILCAIVGNGVQLTALIIIVTGLAIIEHLYTGRGSTVTVGIVFYALTSVIGGFVSGTVYSRSGGGSWKNAMLTSAMFFPGICCAIAFVVNAVAWHYETMHAIPFGTMMIVLAIWIFVSVPLHIVGTIFGRNWCGEPNDPCRVNPIPKYIPDNPWFLRPFAISTLSGLLPFGSIFIEMYFIFTSFWNYKYYYVYGFMLLVFVILIIVSICITIVASYFLLNAEDYRWHWTSMASAASTGVYVYVYSLYYFMAKTKCACFGSTQCDC
jgi:transmembrane 9 superfamily protein 3